MAEINIASLPVMPSSEFTDNDMFVGINNGKAQLITRPTLSAWFSSISQGEKGDQGVAGNDGRDGRDGVNGISVTHRWNGTTLIITSATGTSSVDLKGANGLNGTNGVDGNDGWSPVLSAVARGDDQVLRVVGWTGGTGTQPTTGQYVGSGGLVNNIAQAVNIRGSQGVQGVKGEQGEKGADGKKGADGVNGKSVSTIEYTNVGAVKLTFTDSSVLQTQEPPKQTGWQKYKDSQYTQTTPFQLTAQQEVVLPNNGTIIEGTLPATIPTLYTGTNQKINLKDQNGLYTVRVRFKVAPLSEVSEVRVSFSKDTTEIPFVQELTLNPKTTARSVEISTFIHGDSVLVSNGMSVRIFSEKVLSIYDVEFIIGKVI